MPVDVSIKNKIGFFVAESSLNSYFDKSSLLLAVCWCYLYFVQLTSAFRSLLNFLMFDMLTCHLQLKMKNETMSQIICEDKTFTTSVSFIGLYTHFDSFLSSTYKFCTVYTLAYRCCWICSSWTKLQNELILNIFLKNGFPENFINKSFKRCVDNMHVVTEATVVVEKKSLVLVLQYLGPISLQTRLKNSLKTFLIVVKSKERLKIRAD